MNRKIENGVIKILGDQITETKERVKRVESELREVKHEEGRQMTFSCEKKDLLGRMQAYKVPGVGISVINNHVVEWAKSYGVKDARTGNIVTTETLFEAGSTTKALTATVALHFVEKGSIDLDRSVNDKIVNWKIPDNRCTKEKKISLRHLLTHTAGINRPNGGFDLENGKVPTLYQVLNGEPPALNHQLEVLSVPGEKHEYSNFGYIVIQKLLEDVTGISFPDLMKETLFKPLEMNNSTVNYPTELMKGKATVPHDENGKAKEPGLHPVAFSHGGLLTTPMDLGKYVLELMNAHNGRSERVLSSHMMKKMLTPEVNLNPTEFMGFTGQGLGVFIVEKEQNTFFAHPGVNMPGATCHMIGCAETGQGAVIMTNGINGFFLSLEILFSVAQEYEWTLW